MATQETDQLCDNLVRKLTSGESLDNAEKSHLGMCEGCIAQVVRTLDESAKNGIHGHNPHSMLNGDQTNGRPEARNALEQGRRVFEREFGISLAKE